MPGIYSFKTCINCGLVKRSNGRKYCSINCQHDFQYKEYVKKWLDDCKRGELNGTPLISNYIKKYLIDSRDRKCESCNNFEWMGLPISISVHHIDGNFRNNNPTNLKLLCPNCHAQTPNFGKKNKGNGRPRYFKMDSKPVGVLELPRKQIVP